MSWGDDAPEGQPRGWTPDPDGSARPAADRGWGADDGGGDPLRPMGLADVLDGIFRIGGRHWRAFLIGLGIIVLPSTLLSGLVLAGTVGTTPGLLEAFNDPVTANQLAAGPTEAEIAALVGSFAIAVLVSLVLTPLLYGVAVRIAATAYRTGAVDGVTALKAAARRYLPLLGTTILLWLVPLAVFLVPLALVTLGAVTDAPALAGIGGLGMLVSFVFAILALVRIMLAVPVVIVEGGGPVRALRRSNELVSGRTWPLLGSMIVIVIIVVIISIVLAVPFGIVGGLIGDASGLLATSVSDMLSGIVTNTLLGTALVLFYFDRRVRSEGYDLSELAGGLGGHDPPARGNESVRREWDASPPPTGWGEPPRAGSRDQPPPRPSDQPPPLSGSHHPPPPRWTDAPPSRGPNDRPPAG